VESRSSRQSPKTGEPEEVDKGNSMSKQYKIAVIPGDGTGPEVVAEGIKALKALSKRCGLQFEFKEFRLGGEQYL
jgi:3-isopropylmalate dehydrogenase